MARIRGLSPPTRGNQRRHKPLGESHRGSIPAHAGEPIGLSGANRAHAGGLSPPTRGNPMRKRRRERLPNRVYPRPRGGTGATPLVCQFAVGLSPPTRGNPQRENQRPHADPRRSIPAHAGEPLSRGRSQRPRFSVYPRPRGGTAYCENAQGSGRGLSPPTRGNRNCARRPSICPRAVYPRPRGGTPL